MKLTEAFIASLIAVVCVALITGSVNVAEQDQARFKVKCFAGDVVIFESDKVQRAYTDNGTTVIMTEDESRIRFTGACVIESIKERRSRKESA